MGALISGLLSLLTFFVPLVCPAFALVSVGLAVGSFRRKRQRALAAIGVGLAVAGVCLSIWVWRFGHLP